MVEQFHALASVDITRDPMEVGPTIHYTMGGVRVEAETAATSVPGLYAAGEVAGGLHGANRLGGNSLGDILVFGLRSGEAAAEFARSHDHGRIDESQVAAEQQAVLQPLESDDSRPGENPYLIHEALQDAMQDDAGIARTGESLTRALDAVLELKQRARRMKVKGSRVLNPGWHTCRDVINMLTISEAIVRAALERRESRGSQWRLDYPELSESEGKHNYVAYRQGEEMRIKAVPLEPLPPHLEEHIRKEELLRAEHTIPIRPAALELAAREA
jgi:succinate dehydrogenase / fumarate reductase flavoprotein subunit